MVKISNQNCWVIWYIITHHATTKTAASFTRISIDKRYLPTCNPTNNPTNNYNYNINHCRYQSFISIIHNQLTPPINIYYFHIHPSLNNPSSSAIVIYDHWSPWSWFNHHDHNKSSHGHNNHHWIIIIDQPMSSYNHHMRTSVAMIIQQSTIRVIKFISMVIKHHQATSMTDKGDHDNNHRQSQLMIIVINQSSSIIEHRSSIMINHDYHHDQLSVIKNHDQDDQSWTIFNSYHRSSTNISLQTWPSFSHGNHNQLPSSIVTSNHTHHNHKS